MPSGQVNSEKSQIRLVSLRSADAFPVENASALRRLQIGLINKKKLHTISRTSSAATIIYLIWQNFTFKGYNILLVPWDSVTYSSLWCIILRFFCWRIFEIWKCILSYKIAWCINKLYRCMMISTTFDCFLALAFSKFSHTEQAPYIFVTLFYL